MTQESRSAALSPEAVLAHHTALGCVPPRCCVRSSSLLSAKWHRHYLQLALLCATMSKDPSTQVGAVLVNPRTNAVISTGFNGLPRGLADTSVRLQGRDTKLALVVHAELNAILNAARSGSGSTEGATLYIVAREAQRGEVLPAPPWGGPPCVRCTVHVINAGITQIVSYPRKAVPSRWAADLDHAQALLHEAGVTYTEVPEHGKLGA